MKTITFILVLLSIFGQSAHSNEFYLDKKTRDRYINYVIAEYFKAAVEHERNQNPRSDDVKFYDDHLKQPLVKNSVQEPIPYKSYQKELEKNWKNTKSNLCDPLNQLRKEKNVTILSIVEKYPEQLKYLHEIQDKVKDELERDQRKNSRTTEQSKNQIPNALWIIVIALCITSLGLIIVCFQLNQKINKLETANTKKENQATQKESKKEEKQKEKNLTKPHLSDSFCSPSNTVSTEQEISQKSSSKDSYTYLKVQDGKLKKSDKKNGFYFYYEENGKALFEFSNENEKDAISNYSAVFPEKICEYEGDPTKAKQISTTEPGELNPNNFEIINKIKIKFK